MEKVSGWLCTVQRSKEVRITIWKDVNPKASYICMPPRLRDGSLLCKVLTRLTS